MQIRQGFLRTFATLAILALAPASAFADGRHHRHPHGHHGHHGGARVGVTLNFGAPAYYGYYPRHYWRYHGYGLAPSAYYFYNEIPVVHHYETTRIVESPAPVIAGPPPAQNWYLCPDYDEYYPHVTDCPSAWTVVPATPGKQ